MLQPYEFQSVAVAKLGKVQHALLGDDMGLGKTVTAIELDKVRRVATLSPAQTAWLNKSRKMTLVVTLKSMLGTWEDHLKDWNPSLKVIVMNTKNRQTFVDAMFAQSHDVYICHWEGMRLEGDSIRKIRWLHKIGDEVHRIKNRKAQVTIAYKRIHALFKLDMSGTWADNRPDDAWSILNHLYPNTWTSYNQFYDYHIQYVTHSAYGDCPCPNGHKPDMRPYKEITGVHDAEKLHRQMAPFYVRRTKEEVLKDLPDKYFTKVHVDLSPAQKRAYQDMESDMLAWVGKNEDQPLAAPIAIAKLVRLKQFAVAHGEVIIRKVRVVDEETKEVFYQNKEFLKLTEPSSKLDAFMDRLEMAGDTPQVVFSNSRQVIELLGKRLDKAGISHRLLTGSVSSDDERAGMVRNFQAGKYQVFAGTIKAGGVGITLTRASTVHFLDRHPSPSANRQAMDRCHRIGQKNAVQVIDYIARDTIDAATLEGIRLKWEYLKQILGDKK